jgi:DHA2 family multidrug resistance protein-like MFS transporter
MAAAALACGTAVAVIDGSIVTVALPTVASEMKIEASTALLIVTVYQLVLVMTLIPFSALGSAIGLKRLYQYGQLTFLVSTLLCFFARSFSALLLIRAVQGLGAAASLSVSSGLIRSIYPAEQLGRGLGIGNVVAATASALAPSLGGLVLSYVTWPWIFAAASPLAFVSLWLGRQTLPAPLPHGEPYDVYAAVMCALTFGLVIGGLQAAVRGAAGGVSVVAIVAGFSIGYAFVRRELNSRMPVLPVDLLARPVVALSAAASVIAFAASMTLIMALPFRLQERYGFTPGAVGAMITPWPLAMMVVAPIAGALSDRYPAGLLGAIGMVIAALGALLLAFLPAELSQGSLIWRMALCGGGFGMFLAPNARLLIHAAPRARAASAGGLLSTTRLFGEALGATWLAMLLSMGLTSPWIVGATSACLTVLAGVLSVARLQVKDAR